MSTQIIDITGAKDPQVDLNSAEIAQNKTKIAQNTSEIDTAKQDIAKNTQDIAQNIQNIAQNTSEINTAKQDIAKNTQDISALRSDVDQNANNIQTNTNNIQQLQAAQQNAHTHNNKNILDQLGSTTKDDGSVVLTYNGNEVDHVIAQRDVYDGLDSDDATVSLSARQGKILDQKIQMLEEEDGGSQNTFETPIAKPVILHPDPSQGEQYLGDNLEFSPPERMEHYNKPANNGYAVFKCTENGSTFTIFTVATNSAFPGVIDLDEYKKNILYQRRNMNPTVQLRYSSSDWFSDWSDEYPITIPDSHFDTPSITITGRDSAQGRISLTPTIHVSPFSTTVQGVQHESTVFQVIDYNTYDTVWSVQKYDDTVEVTVPDGVLQPNTTYKFRVTYYDNHDYHKSTPDALETTIEEQAQFTVDIFGDDSRVLFMPMSDNSNLLQDLTGNYSPSTDANGVSPWTDNDGTIWLECDTDDKNKQVIITQDGVPGFSVPESSFAVAFAMRDWTYNPNGKIVPIAAETGAYANNWGNKTRQMMVFSDNKFYYSEVSNDNATSGFSVNPTYQNGANVNPVMGGEEHFVIISYDQNTDTVTTYIDGAESTTYNPCPDKAVNNGTDLNKVYLFGDGANASSNATGGTGKIRMLSMFDRALTTQEKDQLFSEYNQSKNHGGE